MKLIVRRKILRTSILVGLIFFSIVVYQAETPASKQPNPEWVASVSHDGVIRQSLFFESDGNTLEADLILPRGGAEKKPVVLFVTGSGDSLYQDYSPGVLETFVQGVFLPRDFAVFYYNKRGMGQSEGSWLNQDFQGRADDTHAAVNYLKSIPVIDPKRIGLIGHSQGGWIVTLAASQDPDIDFFISLAGPTTSVLENMRDNYRGFLLCEGGFKGEELELRIEKQLRLTKLGSTIGKVLPIGIIGFDANIIQYDPQKAIKSVKSPGLFIFGEHDTIVFAQKNVDTFFDIFDDAPPDNLSIEVIPSATHIFRETNDLCVTRAESLKMPLSAGLVITLENWLSEIGY